jgi:signal transduction histidine kinase
VVRFQRAFFWRATPLAQATFLRHLALLAATIVAFWLRNELAAPRITLWVLGTALLLNVAVLHLGSLSRRSLRIARWASLALGLAAWTLLIVEAGGATSPFCSGLSLEVLFATTVFSAGEVLLITVLSIAALAIAQSLQGTTATAQLWVQAGFLAFLGSLTASVAFCFAQERSVLARATRNLQARVEALQTEADESRGLGQIAEQAARRAHQFKSTLAALRGTLQLLHVGTSTHPSRLQQRSLEVAQSATARLEQMLEETLEPIRTPRAASADKVAAMAMRSSSAADQPTSLGALYQLLQGVQLEVSQAHPGLRWLGSAPSHGERSCYVAFSPQVFCEVATVLLENAAEACGTEGTVALGFELDRATASLVVEDSGTGLGTLPVEQLFRLGTSTTRISRFMSPIRCSVRSAVDAATPA